MKKVKDKIEDKKCVNCIYADFDENCSDDCCICKRTDKSVLKNNDDTCKYCKVAYFQLTEQGFLSLEFSKYLGDKIFTDKKMNLFMECFTNEMKMYGYYVEGNAFQRFFKRVRLHFVKDKPKPFEIFSKNVLNIFGKKISEKKIESIWENFVEFVSKK